MKIIKISTELELTIHDFPKGTYRQQNKELRELIGNYCGCYERVKPKRLYTELHMQGSVTKIKGQSVCMLVDEEGLLKENKPNLIGSYLYGADRHKQYIMGNILFVGERHSNGSVDFCGIEGSVFKKLEQQLNEMILEMKKAREALEK